MLDALRTANSAFPFFYEYDEPLHGDPAEVRVKTPVVFIEGDGIGPDVTAAARRVIDAAFPHIVWHDQSAGASAFEAGIVSGVPAATLKAISETGLVFKGPLATAVGSGGKSANITLRKMFELYANVRPVIELPSVKSLYAGKGIDLVVIRENVEDLYAGIEYMQTPDVAQCLKLVSRMGSEKISRFAFAFGHSHGRSHVTCATKANIMKLTEGFFKEVFEKVAAENPEIGASHLIVDNCVQQLVMAPEKFDVIVTTNMNGDIIGDLAAGLVGGTGLAPSANIGDRVAMFEAAHGTAPDIAGANVANPTALILSGVMMLRHIGAFGAASRIEHALYTTLAEARYLTADIASDYKPVSTSDFASAVVDNLGYGSDFVPEREFTPIHTAGIVPLETPRLVSRAFDGADVFVEWDGDVHTLAEKLKAAIIQLPFSLEIISNRGVMLHPSVVSEAETVNHWQCRFLHDGHDNDRRIQEAICALLAAISGVCTWMHVERLQSFDERPAYSKANGQ